MNLINRHNYETFFLLYTDHELSVAEKKAVDEFVDANPDLQEELVMLQQSVLKPDMILFENKRTLFRNDHLPEGVQEKLLLHIDGELTLAEAKEIEGWIHTNADIKKEWDLLLQTKVLPGRPVVFENKSSLYRKEGGRVIAFPLFRVGVAAAIIAFVVWGGLAYLNKDDQARSVEIAENKRAEPAPETNKPAAGQAATPIISSPVTEKTVVATQVNTTNSPMGAGKLPGKKSPLRKLPKRELPATADIEKTNDLPKPYSENLNTVGSNKTVPAYVTTDKQSPVNNDVDNNGRYTVNEFATTASFEENSGENNNRVLFMNEEKIKKTKLGGLFRKVGRVLGRNANIKPGSNNFKVANLEFAIQ